MIVNCRTTIMRMTTILGQISEIFQWKGNHQQLTEQEIQKLLQLSPQLKEHVSQLELQAVVTHDETVIQLPKLQTQFKKVDFEEMRQRINHWCRERDWEQYHTPRNLVFALVGEVGELSELFQYEVQPGCPEFSEAQKKHLGEELSDVLHNVIRLADRCEVDLSASLEHKMEKNSQKYPIEKCQGSAKKYSDY